MFKVGDKVTRKGAKVWEIAKVETAKETNLSLNDEMIVKLYGSLDAPVYTLKNIETGKVSRNVQWEAKDLTAV